MALAERFVPATDEVWRLQRGSDPECRFFQKIADAGHYGDSFSGSRQGIYICAPSGQLLASLNSNNPDRVLRAMHKGLEAWEELPRRERRLAPDADIRPDHRWEESYPERGLVLRMVTRDLPAAGDPDLSPASPWNRDFVWFSPQEARQWIATDPRPGARHLLPDEFVFRLAGLHLVDTVKGQTHGFARREVAGQIETEVLQRDDAQVLIEIRGKTTAEAAARPRRSSPHGVTNRLLGKATYDLKAQAFVAFELVALGKRWGYTRYNGRRGDTESGPVGFVLRLAPANAPRVAPAFIYSYNVDWVVPPKRR